MIPIGRKSVKSERRNLEELPPLCYDARKNLRHFVLANELYVKVEKPFRGYLNERWLRRVVAQTLVVEGVNSAVELGLVITDDETIRQLNRSYRGRDEATDVLSFAFLEDSEVTPFITPPDGVLHLGEVILSYPQAVAQAEEHHYPLERELALLVIHGVLHLLGHEDEDAQGEAKMRDAEKRVLGELTDECLL
jgi:probable rRNA maturation factor